MILSFGRRSPFTGSTHFCLNCHVRLLPHSRPAQIELRRHNTRLRSRKFALATSGSQWRSRRPAILSVWFVALVLFTWLPAIEAQTRIDKWTTDNGLPQNSINGITKTPDGYVWVTTNEGLVRFDGLRFKVFNRSNTPEISDNRMSGAFTDASGAVWMSTEQGEILRYQDGAFTVVTKPGDILSRAASSFFRDPSGGVIFYTGEGGEKTHTKHYRYQQGRVVPLVMEGIPPESYLVLIDRERGLWFGGGNHLRRYKDGSVNTFDLREFGNGQINRRAYQDRHGSIWVGYTDDKRSLLLRIKDGRLETLGPISAPVTYVSEDNRSNLWLSVFNNGVYRIDQKWLTADAPPQNFLEPVLLVDKVPKIGIAYLCPDNESGMFVGTSEGLLRLMPQTIRVFSTADGLPEDNVYPVYEDKAGRIWAGIWENSLVQFDEGNFKTFLRTYYPTSLFEDHTGRFWLGTNSELYFLEKTRLVKFTQAAGFPPQTEFSVIAEDRNNNLWFGTNLGLSRLAGTQTTAFTKKNGLPDDYVIALLQTHDGKIWVGTRGGLAAFENEKLKGFTTNDGLASNYVRSLYEDADGVLWIGSYDGGLTRFKDGKFTRFTMKDGLSSNGVFCILEDNRGWFWMNSNQGIYRVRKQELNDFADGKTKSLTSIAYNRQDGLLNTEGNGGRQPAGVKARDGKLWFPTARGIAVVDPETVMTNELPPPVLIEEVVVNRNPVANEALQPAIHHQSEIVLAPNQSNLEINYTAISFINSEQVKFKYRLEGLDRDWNDVGTRRTAYYSYLPPGEYTFHVIAANRDGVWNMEGGIIKVKVLPPFYKTYWFVAAFVALFLVMVFIAHRIRVRQLAHEFSMTLEARVGERTRIARDLHDTLLQSFHGLLLRFQSVLKLLPDRPAEAEQRLRLALDQAAAAITEGRDAVQGLRSSALEMNELADGIRAIAEELANDASPLDAPAIEVEVEGTSRNLNPIVRDEAYRIASEALRNAVRHAKASRITVEIRYDKRQLRLRVRDDGKGIDGDIMQRQPSGHFGLPGMHERAEIVGGHLEIWTRLDSGTQVELTIPGSIAYDARGRKKAAMA